LTFEGKNNQNTKNLTFYSVKSELYFFRLQLDKLLRLFPQLVRKSRNIRALVSLDFCTIVKMFSAQGFDPFGHRQIDVGLRPFFARFEENVFEQVEQSVLLHVSKYVSLDRPRMQRVRRHVGTFQLLGELFGEQNVAHFGIRVAVVYPSELVQIVQIKIGESCSDGRHVHHATRGGSLQQSLNQDSTTPTRSVSRLTYEEIRKEKAGKVVDLHEQHQSVFALLVSDPSCSRVVDQNVQTLFTSVDIFGERPHRIERREVDEFYHDLLVSSLFDYLVFCVLGFVLIATSQNDSGASLGEV
jgi:hypothetical protein